MRKEESIKNELQLIKKMIYEIRGLKVMLDTDLAVLYGVEVKVLNQAVKRNIARFPADFMFQLTAEEWQNLRSQFVTFKNETRKYKPYAFTEHGILMLSSVLNSENAVNVNIKIMRIFVKMRQYAISSKLSISWYNSASSASRLNCSAFWLMSSTIRRFGI